MNTLRVEVRRVSLRRLTRVYAALLILGFVVAGTVAFFQSQPIANEQAALEQARRVRAGAVQECITHGGFDFAPPSGPDAGSIEELCDRQLPPPEVFLREQDRSFRLTSMIEVLQGSSALILIVAMVIGASMIGAEWNNRTVTTTLTWEPRRVRLLVAKALAAALVVFAGALAVQIVIVGAFAPAAYFRGVSTVPGGFWQTLAEDMMRLSAIAAGAAVLGFSIATIGRNTAAALGAAFFYLAIAERLLAAWRPGWRSWLLAENMAVVLARFADFIPDRTVLVASLILLGWILAVFGAATAVFRRADIG